MSEIHLLLDKHLELLVSLGSEIEAEVFDPPSAAEVIATLEGAGYHARSEVVDFFTWRSYGDPFDHSRSCSFFRLTRLPLSVESAVDLQRIYRDLRQEILLDEVDDLDEHFPGPDHFLPVVSDRVQILLSVDCRPDPPGGQVVLWDIQGTQKRCFDSLEDAIGTATYCLETGIWELDERNGIREVSSPQEFPDIMRLPPRNRTQRGQDRTDDP